MERNQEIDYTSFHSPLDLLAAIEGGARFDVLLLDVLMPGENGIDAAAEIRNYDSDVKIIFLTSSPEFAVQSYSVDAYFYQLKPIWAESFYRLMDSVLATCEKEQADSLILRCKSGITRIELKHSSAVWAVTQGRRPCPRNAAQALHAPAIPGGTA